MPAFEALLLDPHNKVILDLLFDLATWHAFEKLCIHTDTTLSLFNITTTSLSIMVKKFQASTCSYYYTAELPKEHAAQEQHEASLAKKQPKPSSAKSLAGLKHKHSICQPTSIMH